MDWNVSETCIWFVPPQDNRYACACVGFDDFFPQGGVNDQGLFYDCTLCPYLEVINSSDKPQVNGFLGEYCLERCATIGEVLAIYETYNLNGMETYQIMFVDRTGYSVIIEGDEIIRKHDFYQITLIRIFLDS